MCNIMKTKTKNDSSYKPLTLISASPTQLL